MSKVPERRRPLAPGDDFLTTLHLPGATSPHTRAHQSHTSTCDARCSLDPKHLIMPHIRGAGLMSGVGPVISLTANALSFHSGWLELGTGEIKGASKLFIHSFARAQAMACLSSHRTQPKKPAHSSPTPTKAPLPAASPLVPAPQALGSPDRTTGCC